VRSKAKRVESLGKFSDRNFRCTGNRLHRAGDREYALGGDSVLILVAQFLAARDPAAQ
jgi:hypothetical protein